MKLIGYARVSTGEQDLSLQLDALQQAGCDTAAIFVDKSSGAKTERPGLDTCLKTLQPGDTLLVWRLDRLGRSMTHLVTMVEDLRRKGVGFRSLCDGAIDTTTASGELVLNIFSSLAQFERRLLQERTRAGLAAARARGRKGGRRAVSKSAPKVMMAWRMYQDKSLSVNDICEALKISSATFFRYIALVNNTC